MIEPIPFPFQQLGGEWLARNKLALLADEMGLGKSRQTVIASDLVNATRILVVCPAVARVNWQREFARWSPLSRPFDVLLSFSDEPSTSTHSVICGYEYATRFSGRLNESGLFDRLIIDETHFLKSSDAKRTEAVFGQEGLARNARGVWALSGTPAPNAHASELWVLLHAFGATSLGKSAFMTRYCDVQFTQYGPKVIGTKKDMIPELKEMLARVMLRRRIDDVLPEMPPIFFHDPMVVLPGKVEGLDAELEAVLAKERGQISEILDRDGLTDEDKLKLLEGLAKSVSTLRRYTGLQIVEPACELVAGELDAGLYSKIVIFAIHKEVIARVYKALVVRGKKGVILNGECSPAQKQLAIDTFQNNASCEFFLGNIQSAGTNATLTAAHQELFIEKDWVPGNNAQAAMRCRRIGQTRPVIVRSLTINHPINERVARALSKKTKELTEIFDA